jgi:hypothetical protein
MCYRGIAVTAPSIALDSKLIEMVRLDDSFRWNVTNDNNLLAADRIGVCLRYIRRTTRKSRVKS